MIFKLVTLLLVSELALAQVPVASVNWNGQNWAMQCDFKGRDMGKKHMKAELCGPTCEKTTGCTHFVWTSYEGGTCWLTDGTISQDDAFLTDDVTMVCGIIAAEVITYPPPVKGELLWSSDFDSVDEFERNWWQETGGHGWGNNESQFYTGNRRNVDISNGQLTIETRKEPYLGRSYTSTRLVSRQKFKYGFYEMRAKLATGRGIWPAFWLLAVKRPLNWPLDGEIDVMEYVGYDPNVVHGTIHCQAYNHLINTQKGKQINFDDQVYNVFQLDWQSDRIKIYINDVQYFDFKKESDDYNVWPFDNEMNMLLNTAVGGNWGGIKGIDDSIFPVQYNIDYVRIFDNGENIQIS